MTEELAEFLRRALDEDPICVCGDRQHVHSDDGPCYGCSHCNYFVKETCR